MPPQGPPPEDPQNGPANGPHQGHPPANGPHNQPPSANGPHGTPQGPGGQAAGQGPGTPGGTYRPPQGPGPQGGPYPGPGQYGPPPGQASNTGTVVGLAFAGVALYFVINVALALVALGMSGGGNQRAAFAVVAILLGLIAFGGGIALVIVRKPWSKGLGLGLMIGWALASIVSAGYCTGLNPGMYA